MDDDYIVRIIYLVIQAILQTNNHSAASGFLGATTQGTLSDIENVRKLGEFLLRAFLMVSSNQFLRGHDRSELKHEGACGVPMDRLYRMAA